MSTSSDAAASPPVRASVHRWRRPSIAEAVHLCVAVDLLSAIDRHRVRELGLPGELRAGTGAGAGTEVMRLYGAYLMLAAGGKDAE